MHKRLLKYSIFLFLTFLISSCYNHQEKRHDALPQSNDQLTLRIDSVEFQRQHDSISFTTTHHYGENYNFVVKTDSLRLLRQQPEEVLSQMPTDTLCVYRNQHLVVADIRILPADSIDTVWVQLARDQLTFGWIHESELLTAVMPDDPISQFISLFSDIHLLVALLLVLLIATLYIARKASRRQAHILHFNDIPSPYPLALALTVATSSTLYATIQKFAPEMWRHFYYHPTLNPFALPFLLAIFLASVWLILILAIAAVDEVRKHLPFSQAALYCSALAAICAVLYVIFSITTLYYIGYPLLVAYFYFAIKQYLKST